MPESPENQGLAEAGRYARLRDANERVLVILSMGLGCWLFKDGSQFVLCVESRHVTNVQKELAAFEAENRRGPKRAEAILKTPPLSLFVFGWGMMLFFLVQQRDPDWWVAHGGASTSDIFRNHHWWRIVTALTLHADVSHLAANLAAELLFAAFLLPLLGTGVTWMSVLLTGALGNLVNAWFYSGEPRTSIGASTAVFGTLGILAACQTVDTIAGPRKVRLWEVILPLGAGLALLAFLGTEGEHTDFMAHFWGFTSGLGVGALAAWSRIKERVPSGVQGALALLAPAALVAAWLRAATP